MFTLFCHTNQYFVCFYCSLGATCNHIAAVLFKLDHAWQSGLSNMACTSLPAAWIVPSTKKVLQPKKVNDMEWRKPHYRNRERKVINPVARKLFSPMKKAVEGPTIEALMGSLYVSFPGASCFQYAAAHATAGYCVEDDVNVAQEEEVVTTETKTDTIKVQLRACDGSLEKIPALTPSQLDIVEGRTRGQSGNAVWIEQRCGRITASVAHMTLTKARKITS